MILRAHCRKKTPSPIPFYLHVDYERPLMRIWWIIHNSQCTIWQKTLTKDLKFLTSQNLRCVKYMYTDTTHAQNLVMYILGQSPCDVMFRFFYNLVISKFVPLNSYFICFKKTERIQFCSTELPKIPFPKCLCKNNQRYLSFFLLLSNILRFVFG